MALENAIVFIVERIAFAFVLFTLPFYTLILFIIGRQCWRNSRNWNSTGSCGTLASPFFRLMFVTGLIDISEFFKLKLPYFSVSHFMACEILSKRKGF